MTLGRRVLRLAGNRLRQELERALDAGLQASHGSPSDTRPGSPPPLRTFGTTEPRSRTPPPAPNPAQPHPYQHEYRLLGAPVGSDLPTVRRHWQQLVRQTHPDHFAEDPVEQRRATDRLRRLNAAFERLGAYLESESG